MLYTEQNTKTAHVRFVQYHMGDIVWVLLRKRGNKKVANVQIFDSWECKLYEEYTEGI